MTAPSRRNRRRSSVAQEGNPLKDDPTLRKQMMQLDRVKTLRKFEPWKSAFLKRFEDFLERDGLRKAQEAYSEFSKGMDRTVALVNKCEEMHQKGDLTNERATVKGRHALNEMVNNLVVGHAAIKKIIPGTGDEEESCGYNKFMLGAILVRDNFSEYERMQYVNDTIQVMSEKTLTDVADRVHLEQFANYQTQFQRMCGVLSDLGLYEVMMACRKFSDNDEEDYSLTEVETESESDSFVESLIFADMKTGSVFQMPIDLAHEKRIINIAKKMNGDGEVTEEYIGEACQTEAEREAIKTKLNSHPTLGVATKLVIRKSVAMENEYTELKEKEAVTNMWGVTLKQTNKKSQKNEELFFFDPYSGSFGQVDRNQALTTGFIHEVRNQFDAVVLKEAEEDSEEWESIRGMIRKVVGIQMEESRDDSISSLRFSGNGLPIAA